MFLPYRKTALAALLAAGLLACRRDHPPRPAPAAHIAQSEKAVLPAAVALPLNPPKGTARVATYYATGVQQYKAREKAGSSPVAYEWALVAPKADLYDATNKKVGFHGAGPFWTVGGDSLFAQHFSPARTAPSPDGGSIDWLLLQPKAGTTPQGRFAAVAYIQRIATRGGKPPAAPPVQAEQTVDVPYEAVYRFSKNN
ncbi:MAG TPA: DUF3455 domain-containing protein [Chitinophagaceae bacterium]|jgi:hypothetical protein|nr:DUF3455 domain-containing protein [Chitinophagaceae bacterium]